MAFWDPEEKRIIRHPPKDYPGNSNWAMMDCGCCNGLQWGGYSPRECWRCKGAGWYALHKESGVIAEYPGGPFLGSRPDLKERVQ